MMRNSRHPPILFPLLLCVLIFCLKGIFSAEQTQDHMPEIDDAFQKIFLLLDGVPLSFRTDSQFESSEFKNVYKDLFDLEGIAEEAFQKHRKQLKPSDWSSLKEALEVSMLKKGMRLYEQLKKGGNVRTSFVSSASSKQGVQAVYSFRGEEGRLDCVFHLTDRSGERIITDIESNGFRLTTYYRKFANDVLKKYPLPVLITELKELDYILADDFSGDRIGGLTRHWRWKKDENDELLLSVREENGNRFINVRDKGDSVTYGREFRWNIKKYPYISWRWRVHALPQGGDERFNETNDSAAAVYILYGKNIVGVPKVVKYVWSTTLPKGTATRRKGIGRPWTIVARSGEKDAGIWHTEVFNAWEAFRKTFGGEPPDDALGIAVLTDANATDTYAEADYDDFMFLQTSSAGSGVKQFMEGGK